MENNVASIRKLIKGISKAVIVMHRGPDGDAVGSALGWSRLLKTENVETVVVAPDAFPGFLAWLPGAAEVLIYENKADEVKRALGASDAVFCLDFNAPDRMGKASEAVTEAGKPIVVIDHHRFPKDFAAYYYVDDTACATAEMIFRLAGELGFEDRIDRETALCLYTGLVTDTGSFRFSSVNADVLRIAASLLDTGMHHTDIYDHVYDNNRLDQLKLKGYALSEKTVVTGHGKAAYISLTARELERFNFRPGDTEGLVNYALGISGVEVAAFFAEKDDLIKISLRSKGVDVNALAGEHFDGGGHIFAAGGRSKTGMEATVRKFESLVNELFAEPAA